MSEETFKKFLDLRIPVNSDAFRTTKEQMMRQFISNNKRRLKKIFSPLIRNQIGTITHVNTLDPVVALTFDDGPHPVFTSELLNILDKHRAHATFFMVGEAAEKYPHVVQMVAQSGHAIGNHSWDHPKFPLISRRDRRKQIYACGSAIAPYGQPIFRPPWGLQSIQSRLDTFLLGYQVIAWNVTAEDWLPHTSQFMADRLITRIKAGSIVLLHDAIYRSLMAHPQWDRQTMLKALEMVLPALSEKFQFITIPQLLQHGSPVRNY